MTFGYSILMCNEFNGITILINPVGISGLTPVPGNILLLQVGMNVDDLYSYMGMHIHPAYLHTYSFFFFFSD